MYSLLENDVFRKALIGILVQKLGGRVRLEQSDFDDIFGKMLMKDTFPDDSVEFYIQEKEAAS